MSWIWVSIKQLFLSFGLLRPVCEVHLRELLVCEVGVHLRELLVCEVGVHLRELFQVSLSAQPLFAKQHTVCTACEAHSPWTVRASSPVSQKDKTLGMLSSSVFPSEFPFPFFFRCF